MSTGSINSLSSTYLLSILNDGITNNNASPNKNLSSIDTSSIGQTSDNSQLSHFAELLSKLQQLQQSDPTKYQQVTQQIATNLQNAAQTAESEGNTAAAGKLNQLATDFTTASKSGQLPNVQDLAQAISSHARGHHHHAHSAPASDDDSSTSSTSGTASQTSSPLPAAFQSGAQSDTLNPVNIIFKTLSDAQVNVTKG
jgi:hypothetical protein